MKEELRRVGGDFGMQIEFSNVSAAHNFEVLFRDGK